MSKNLNIYTDGSFSSTDKISSIAFLYFNDEDHKNIRYFMSSKNTKKIEDNNIIEGDAVKYSLKNISIQDYNKITIFTDSKNVLNYLTNNSNKEYFEDLKKKIPLNVEFKWVKGHSSNIFNNTVDLLCKISKEKNKKQKIINNEYEIIEYEYDLVLFNKLLKNHKNKKIINYIISTL